MDGDIGFGRRQRKRPHSSMEHDRSSLSPTWFPSDTQLSATRGLAANTNDMPPHRHSSGLPPAHAPPFTFRRFPGDGLDYRRPAHLSFRPSTPPIHQTTVIDLTDEDVGPSPFNTRRHDPPPQRQPRFARNIMDTHEVINLEDEEDGSRGINGNGTAGPGLAPASPDIEFVSSRILPPRPRRNSDNDLEITGSAPAPERARRFPGFYGIALGAIDPRGRPHIDRLRDHFLRISNGPVAANRRPPTYFQGPNLDFESVGFRLYGDTPVPPPAPPTYKAPEPALDGFTRTVKEADSLVCPNCDDELCQGDTDTKKQVWIVKACGHVYCGECTANRFVSKKSVKGKEKKALENHKPFKACVVDGCLTKVASRTAMIQLFL